MHTTTMSYTPLQAEKLSAFTPGPGRYAPEDVNAVGRVNTVYKRTVGFNGESASHSPTYSFGRSATVNARKLCVVWFGWVGSV